MLTITQFHQSRMKQQLTLMWNDAHYLNIDSNIIDWNLEGSKYDVTGVACSNCGCQLTMNLSFSLHTVNACFTIHKGLSNTW